jgi:hypothetical protein
MWSLLLFAASAHGAAMPPGLDARLLAGLAVTVERIAEPVTVDGVSMAVQRVTGTGVPELARRIQATWQRAGSMMQTRQQESWIVVSRIQGPVSEVLQWRSNAGGAELLLSSLNLQASVRRLPNPGLTLPAGCIWGRSVAGKSGEQSYMQRSARCPHSKDALSLQLRRSLPTQGWSVRRATDSGFVVERSGSEGFVGISIQEGGAATWVSWLRIEANP